LNIYPENILIGECVKLTDYGIKMTGKNEEPQREYRHFIKGDMNYLLNAYHTPEEILGLLEGKWSLLVERLIVGTVEFCFLKC
jgi:hypothetical protein